MKHWSKNTLLEQQKNLGGNDACNSSRTLKLGIYTTFECSPIYFSQFCFFFKVLEEGKKYPILGICEDSEYYFSESKFLLLTVSIRVVISKEHITNVFIKKNIKVMFEICLVFVSLNTVLLLKYTCFDLGAGIFKYNRTFDKNVLT